MKITAKVVGGAPQDFDDVETVGDVRKRLKLDKGYAATVNGEPEDDNYELNDYEYVTFAPAVKGGRR